MPIPIKRFFVVQKNKLPIVVTLEFKTMLLCRYEVDLAEKLKNSSVTGYPRRGDNTNPQDDRYTMPKPPKINIGRHLWITTTVISQDGSGGDYTITATITQGDQTMTVTTGEKHLTGDATDEYMVVNFQ